MHLQSSLTSPVLPLLNFWKRKRESFHAIDTLAHTSVGRLRASKLRCTQGELICNPGFDLGLNYYLTMLDLAYSMAVGVGATAFANQSDKARIADGIASVN
jgi:hypothetical protein